MKKAAEIGSQEDLTLMYEDLLVVLGELTSEAPKIKKLYRDIKTKFDEQDIIVKRGIESLQSVADREYDRIIKERDDRCISLDESKCKEINKIFGITQDLELERFYLTIGAEGVKTIELTMPNSIDACENEDGSLFKKADRILLECLDGYKDLRGVSIRALCEGGEILWTASIPDSEDNEGFTHLRNDDSHIPDYYRWERQQVRQDILDGNYKLDADVEIAMQVDYKAIYKVGEGHLIHDNTGFTLTGCDGKLRYTQKPQAGFGLYADYYWYEIGDVICIGDTDVHYFLFPKGGEPVAKIRLATEEMFKLYKERKLNISKD